MSEKVVDFKVGLCYFLDKICDKLKHRRCVMEQDVQDKINALAKKIKGLSVQELHFLSKEVESQRKRQDYEESKWLDTEIKKGDINEFETPDKIDTLVGQGADIQTVDWNKLIKAIHSNASKYRPVAQAVIYNGYKLDKDLVQRREVRRVVDYCLAHPEGFKTTKMRIDARHTVRDIDKYLRVELPQIIAQEKASKKEILNNDINVFESAEKIDRLIKNGVDIQSVKWNELYDLFVRNQRQYTPIIRAVIYNGYDFSYNPDILHKKDVRHEVNYCLAHPEGFKTPEIRTTIRAIVRENDKYYKELPKIQAQQRKEKEQQKKEQRENDINYHLDNTYDLSATKIDKLVKKGVDIQQIDWSNLKYLSYKNNGKYKKVMRAIIYNGYDFSQALSVLCHSKVLPLAEECLQHPKAFKVEGAYESLQSIVPIAREYLDQRNEDYKLALEQEKQARLLEQKKEEEYLERQRIIAGSGINSFSSAEKINECVDNGADIQWIDWEELINQFYVHERYDEGTKEDIRIMQAIIYNGYDFSDAISTFNKDIVRETVDECLTFPDNFRVYMAYEKLYQFVSNREKIEEEERRQAQIARDNDVNIFTSAEKIDKVVRKGIDIQQVDWDKVNHLEGAQYEKIVRAIIYNGFDFTKKEELLNNGKINALARDCLKHPDAFKVKGAYKKLDKQMKAQKVDKIMKVLATHKVVRF